MAKRKQKQVPAVFHVRWMIRRDMPNVLEAERGTCREVEEIDLLRWLRQRSCIGMVVEISNREHPKCDHAIAHMVYGLRTHSLKLLRFVVNKDWRKCGAGRMMLEKLFSKLSAHRRNQLIADVPEECLEMQLFLKRHGFRCTSIVDDAYRMVYAFDAADGETELDARPGLGVNRVAALDQSDVGGEA